MRIIAIICGLGLFGAAPAIAGDDALQQYQVGETAVKFALANGANLFSIRYRGVELLQPPASETDMKGFRYGTPILYPTPNRVRDARFQWEGKEYAFPANERTNFLHGLVHSVAWTSVSREASSDQALIQCELPFEAGRPWFDQFPFPHILRLAISVRDGSVRWTYTVDNSKGSKAVPMGFALHPWFLYQGERKNTRLTVPATHVMEAKNMLPTGKLLPLEGSTFDARQGKSLDGFVIDDVYYGMQQAKPTILDFRDKGITIRLTASDDFTHLVVYTPADKPWFCVENQTCSTDAHNLFGQGLKKESNLIIVPPGKTHTGWVEFAFEKK